MIVQRFLSMVDPVGSRPRCTSVRTFPTARPPPSPSRIVRARPHDKPRHGLYGIFIDDPSPLLVPAPLRPSTLHTPTQPPLQPPQSPSWPRTLTRAPSRRDWRRCGCSWIGTRPHRAARRRSCRFSSSTACPGGPPWWRRWSRSFCSLWRYATLLHTLGKGWCVCVRGRVATLWHVLKTRKVCRFVLYREGVTPPGANSYNLSTTNLLRIKLTVWHTPYTYTLLYNRSPSRPRSSRC